MQLVYVVLVCCNVPDSHVQFQVSVSIQTCACAWHLHLLSPCLCVTPALAAEKHTSDDAADIEETDASIDKIDVSKVIETIKAATTVDNVLLLRRLLCGSFIGHKDGPVSFQWGTGMSSESPEYAERIEAFKSLAAARPAELQTMWKQILGQFLQGVKMSRNELTAEGEAVIYFCLDQVKSV